jgi:hypothetical protein
VEERDDVEGLVLYDQLWLVIIATMASERTSQIDLQIETCWARVICKIIAGSQVVSSCLLYAVCRSDE